MLIRCFPILVCLITSASYAVAQVTPPAVLNPSNADLRLWLKTDAGMTLGPLTPGQPGPPVLQWKDQSQYGTILAPRTSSNPNGPIGGFPVEENPHLQNVSINGKSVPSVRFDVSGEAFDTGDPNVDGSGARDRLYQTNNLAPNFDPLDIYDGSSLTTFIVFNPDFTTTTTGGSPEAHGWNAVFGKRGPNSSAYGLSIKNYTNFGNFVVVQYDANEQYHSLATPRPLEKVWHVSALTIQDNPGAVEADVLSIFDDGSQNPADKMVSLGVGKGNGTPLPFIASRNPSTPEPFGIGGHSQNCCGELERFSGNIAELIIFARMLTPEEFSDVEDYLDAKYFAPESAGVPGDYNSDGQVNAADYTIWRDRVGADTLPNRGTGIAGAVGPADYDFWKSRFGTSGGRGSVSAVPEPAGILLGGMAMLGSLAFVRKR